MYTDVGVVSHLIATVGFGALACILILRKRAHGPNFWLVLASVITMLWAADFVMSQKVSEKFLILLPYLETIRTLSWIVFLISLLNPLWSNEKNTKYSFFVACSIGFISALQILIDIVSDLEIAERNIFVGQIYIICRMIMPIAGLILTHNLYINSQKDNKIEIWLLVIGLTAFFGYDLNLYTLNFLLGHISIDLYNIRGVVNTIFVPLIILTFNGEWISNIKLSRQIAFHTFSFSLIGTYLIIMAFISYGLRFSGGNWGALLQISFISITMIFGFVILISPKFRAKIRVIVSKNFFKYKYDYRQEWLRFIKTVSNIEMKSDVLQERVIKSVCEVLDSPGGILYTVNDEGNFEISAVWNFLQYEENIILQNSDLVNFVNEKKLIINFDEIRNGAGDYGGMRLPIWAAVDRRLWIAVPLIHIDTVVAILIMERSLISRDLNWEDYDLLRTLGRQAASYIAEATSQAALDEAGKFDEFNRRFAFIMHDIKNLVSQLSLVARNAERHADNPDFRADMVATLQSSVGKMNDMLARLAQHNTAKTERPTAIDLQALAAQVVATMRRSYPDITMSGKPAEAIVMADANKVEQVLNHLLQNAVDASAGATICVAVQRSGDDAVISISDSGTGMSPTFVRNELFKPFHSTKSGGFGIGAYEARSIIKALHGRLDVVSREGFGTVFSIVLPAGHDGDRI